MAVIPAVDDVAPEPSGRRERKKRQTRNDLVVAAARLFGERGFDETTTEDIAEAADVSQRTFFRHFPSKEAVLYGDHDAVRSGLERAILEQPDEESPLGAVIGALGSLTDYYTDDAERTLLQARLAASSPAVSAYSRAVVQQGMERAIIGALAERMRVDPMTDPRPEVIAGATLSALRVSMRQWVARGGRDDLLEIAAAALASFGPEAVAVSAR